MTVVVFACLLLSNTAAAQTFVPSDDSDLRFSIDLNELTRIYDELYPERTAVAAWDTLPPFDWSNIVIGNQRYKVPHFLETSADRMTTRLEFSPVLGKSIRFHYPAEYSMNFVDLADDTSGFFVQQPRNLAIPNLGIQMESVDELAENIRRNSLRETWRETTREYITTQSTSGVRESKGFRINIPLPLPRFAESIFGPAEKTHINVTGREEITFAGETRIVNPYLGVEGKQDQSLFPSLDMRQNLDVQLTGTIGDKVNVQVSHSSDAGAFDDANRIRVNYVGYDDDIIKLVELGNTSLSIPGSQLVSAPSGNSGLFGIKVLAQLGATDLTFIASKSEGETSSASFSPSAGGLGQTETRTLRDLDYERERYFWFDIPFGRNLINVNEGTVDVYRLAFPEEVAANPELKRFYGWAYVDESGEGADIPGQINAQAADPGNLQNETIIPQWELLQRGVDFTFVVDAESNLFIGIELSRSITRDDRALAVRYTAATGAAVGGSLWSYEQLPGYTGPATNSPNNDDEGLVATNPLILKYLRKPNQQPSDTYVWNLMMRNIYNLRLSNIDPATFTLEIEDNLGGGTASNPRLDATRPEGLDLKYITIFGLDRTDQTGLEGTGPDNLVDLSTGFINLDTGVLTMPSSRAFDPSTAQIVSWIGDQGLTVRDSLREQFETAARIYDEIILPADESEVHQYLIKVSGQSTTRTFRIDALNIIEGSERITLDGQVLSRGSDYDINYQTGEVELKSGALDRMGADSRINIDYEFTPFGGSSSSSLVGVNATSKLGENGRFGTTWLYESKSTTQNKARLGEEPSRAVVGGANLQYQREVGFLTRLVNTLPLVDSDAPSSVNFNGEFAVSIPDPNTRGEAYIDDFEGVEDSDRIIMSRRGWHPASIPLDDAGTELDATRREPFVWYNIEPAGGATNRDLNPLLNKDEETRITTLDIDLDGTPQSDSAWVGVMTGFPGGIDITEGQFIEFWINDFKGDDVMARGGKIHIDLGNIDENFYAIDADTFNFEDRARDGWVAAFDDNGLDGVPDELEDPAIYDPTTENPSGLDFLDPRNDPNGDNIITQRIDGAFSRINGTEKNQINDTEDLDGNSQFDRLNSFYRYTIDLSSVPEEDIRIDFPTHRNNFTDENHELDSWRRYRVRLSDGVLISPTGQAPRLDQVRHMRIWSDSLDGAFGNPEGRIQLAEVKIQGNRWLLDGVRTVDDTDKSEFSPTEFEMRVISNKTDPTVYSPPFRPNEEQGVFEKESSLALSYSDLQDTTAVRIRKPILGNGLDVTLYREINMFVHTDSLRDDVEYFFRLATSEKNYYEIAVPLEPPYFENHGRWSRILVKLSEFTDLKFSQPDSLGITRGFAADDIEDRAYPVSIKGQPNLFQIRFLYAGVRNKFGGVQSGEIWIDDIYLGDVRRDIDHAERLGVTVSLAGGVMSFTGSWSRTGPDFRGLRQRKGRGSTEEAVGLNAKTDLRYLVPLAGFSVPISGSFNRSTSKPKFQPNSDTELTTEALRDSLKSVRTSRTINTSIQRRGSKNPFLKYTIDKMTSNFTYTETNFQSPARLDTTVQMRGAFGYTMNWTAKREIPIFPGVRMRYWPNSLTYRLSANRQTVKSWFNSGDGFRPNPYRFSAALTNSGDLNYAPFRSLSGTFSMTIDRDVGRPHKWLGIDVGTETKRRHNTRISYKPEFRYIREIQPIVDLSAGYTEDSSPNVRRVGDPRGTRNVSVNRLASLKTRFDIGKWFARGFEWIGFEVNPEENQQQRRPRGIRQTPMPNPNAGQPGGSPTPAGQPGGVPGGPRPPVPGVPPDSAVTDTTRAGGSAAAAQPTIQPAGQPPVTGVLETGAQLPVDSTVAEPDTTRRRDPIKASLRFFARALTELRRINANFTQRMSNNYSRIPDRPDLGYQLGLKNDTGIELGDGTKFDEPERLTESMSMNFDSGVQLTKQFDLQGRYQRSINDTDYRASQNRSTSTTWPDLQVNWSGLEEFGLVKPFFLAAQANISYRETNTESGRLDAEPDNLTQNRTISPALLFTWKKYEVNSNLSVSYSSNRSETRGSGSKSTNLSVNLDFKKTFRGGAGFKLPIPFFRKELRWSSRLEANMAIAYARAGGERFTAGLSGRTEPIPQSTSLRVSPNFNYQFSNTLNGSMFVDYARNYSEATGQTTTTVRVGVSAIFTF